jgi:PleD family two-component response regulator
MYGISRGYGVEWLAEILETLRSTDFEVAKQTVRISFSAGVTQYPEDGNDIQTLYHQAASTIEEAKNRGGNCILPSNLKPLQSERSPRNKGVILLHQDSAFANSVMEALLTRSYEVRWLKDGKTALEALAEKSPLLHGEIILLEENLPGLNGLEILKHFKKDKIIQRSKVVWLSTATNQVEKALCLGCFDYINVPCNISAFMYRLRHCIEG